MSRFKKIVKRTIVFFVVIIVLISIFWVLGSEVTNNTDSYVYDLPFKAGTSHRIIQGYGGWFSHKNIAALDFYMPVGTPVYAAREGVIYSYKEDSNKGGP